MRSLTGSASRILGDTAIPYENIIESGKCPSCGDDIIVGANYWACPFCGRVRVWSTVQDDVDDVVDRLAMDPDE